ncbi:hypothetical protein GF337_15400 [candidate division KSB1 bacterium]|nr:hypothetical protein [candidate division KSB1 bacterium]
MNNSKTSLLPGILLIIIGSLLLIHKLNIFYFDWQQTYPILFILIGIMLFVSYFMNRNTNSVFWGTIIALAGVFFFLRNYHVIDYYYMSEAWPVFMIILGIAFLVLFVVKPQDWGVLIPAGIFLVIGTSFLLRNLHLWYARDIIQRYWPLLLIIIGAGVILSSFKKEK